eukprot:COSAG01_NODE_5286_length_4356_cov_15.681466_4_plen_657_part_00
MAEFDHVIPLPKEAFIVARHAVSVSEVRLLCCGATAAGSTPAGPLSLPMHERTVRHAFERLASLFPTECQSHPDDDVPSGSGDCRLLIVVGLVCAGTGGWLDPPPPPPTQGRWMSPAHEAACGLAALPNSEQAYTIQPIGQHELHVAALSGPGLYYAVQTLSQLLRPALAGGTTRGMVELPLPSVVDWPDTEERGVWNGVCDEDWVEWMSAMKLNFANQGSTPAVFQRGVRVTQTMEPEMMHAAALRGFRYVPQIVHLNFLDGWGLFRAYPELAGIGDSALAGRYFAHKTGDQHRCPDAGNPLLVQILAEWMEEIAQHFVPGGTQDISCWLTERPAEDGRTSTAQGGGQFVLEARAFVAAWQQAREKYPQLIIRLFLSTTAPQRDDVILAEAPPEVKVVRCCFTDTERSAHQPRDLFADACLDAEASSGRWLGTYDVPLTCNGRVETPMFKLPHRSAHRIQDFVVQMVRRRYSSIAGMLGWAFAADQMCGFNIGALAEWSWNSRGRTPEQFARAWALRSGLGDTDTADNFVKWQSLMGPIEWDVYDSDFPTSYNCPLYVDGPTPPPGVPGLEMYIKQQLTPQLGVGPFRYFSTPSSFDEKLAACEEAAALVGKETILGEMDPTLGREVEVIASYVDLLGSIYVVRLLLPPLRALLS